MTAGNGALPAPVMMPPVERAPAPVANGPAPGAQNGNPQGAANGNGGGQGGNGGERGEPEHHHGREPMKTCSSPHD